MGPLFRLFAVQKIAGRNLRNDWIIARAARFRGCGTFNFSRRCCGRRRHLTAEFLEQFFEHPVGFFAARYAEIEPLFGLQKQRVRIVFAIVTALAAILLRHCRHQLAAKRARFGKLHAVGHRHGLVVPWRFAVIAVVERALGRIRHQAFGLIRRKCRHLIQ
jgi:hypothetical protein